MGFNLDNYETVEDRLVRFWNDHPNGRIYTEMVHYDDTKVVFKTSIYFDAADANPKATGFAEEVRGASPVNKTSHLENCETGAVGRALANAGLSGSDFTKRPSREEMGKVVRMQGDTQITESSNLASDKQLNMIRAVCKSMGRTVPSGIQGWSKREASQFIDTLKNGELAAPQYETPEEPF
jgi:hypothetical protein